MWCPLNCVRRGEGVVHIPLVWILKLDVIEKEVMPRSVYFTKNVSPLVFIIVAVQLYLHVSHLLSFHLSYVQGCQPPKFSNIENSQMTSKMHSTWCHFSKNARKLWHLTWLVNLPPVTLFLIFQWRTIVFEKMFNVNKKAKKKQKIK